MTRPQIIRADTMDLQTTDAPSAKDHSRQPTTPNALGEGPAAPHQASALKSAGLEGIELRSRSPRASQDLSGKEIQLLQSHEEGDQAAETNLDEIGLGSQDEELDSDAEGSIEDDMMDKISSSPSIDDEDIDFEFVYALHTFVATVDGQANATKGDTMVLLDDSNSYWWLVRIVKDSSIGYLPAEHIETPTERLARLNKHRNIDLSQAMLGDNAERARSNPLRKARKRRNAKMVQFADPIYYAASEHEYSSDDDASPDDMEFITTAEDVTTNGSIEPVKENVRVIATNIAPVAAETPVTQEASIDHARMERSVIETTAAVIPVAAAGELARASDNSLQASSENMEDPSLTPKTRMRNTDSFYKDDTIETRRINLTPSLLREDKAAAGDTQQNNRTRSSSESTVKSTNSDKPVEKRKEKKSVLGRLFKAKNSKKIQAEEEAEEWIAKDLTDKSGPRSTPDTSSMDTGSTATVSTKGQPGRNGSKLQKSPPPQKSNSFNKGPRGPTLATSTEPTVSAPQLEAAPAISPITNPFSDENYHLTQQKSPLSETATSEALNYRPDTQNLTPESQQTLFAPVREISSNTGSSAESKPERVKKASTREPIEDSDGYDAEPDQPRNINGTDHGLRTRLSESPVHVVAPNQVNQYQPRINHITHSAHEPSIATSGSSTPELIERPSQETGASNDSTIESSAGSSKKDNFNWTRCKKWFDEEFNDWYTCLMDVSDEVKDFNWKNHWAYKDYCEDVLQRQEDIVDELDWSLVDYYDIEHRQQQRLPQFHPQYRHVGWEEQWMRHEQDCLQKGENPGWLPWDDVEYAYLYPHRSAPAGAAAGPPAGSICRPQHELKIIGPAALTMKLPGLDDNEHKGFSRYPTSSTLA